MRWREVNYPMIYQPANNNCIISKREYQPKDFKLCDAYLDLLKKSLTDSLRLDKPQYSFNQAAIYYRVKLANWLNLIPKGICMARPITTEMEARREGKDVPLYAETMIGLKRLDHIRYCLIKVFDEQIPGDFIETGVWRGGACIFARAIMHAHNQGYRKVWVADSFQGLPQPNEMAYEADKGDRHYLRSDLSISLEEVQDNFRRYNLLDENVIFVKGWFKDTLPHLSIKELAVMRLDGDMYESTIIALSNLYPKLVIGGYCIIDDYGAIDACRKAVDDYRNHEHINDEIKWIDWTGAYWRKQQI